MKPTQNYQNKQIANMVVRRDFSKLEPNFEEPNLLELQKKSYDKFLNEELEKLILSYFPIQHVKNSVYDVKFKGLKLVDSKRNEEQARFEGKTYEKSLYVDLELHNTETGEVEIAKKTKTNLSTGVFFANIPMMTKNGTFIVNGIEKFVISQIVRSPGAYILTKSQIKLNNKKKINEGYVCEVLPGKGSMMNFWLDEKNHTINVSIRNSTGDSAPTFPATQLLKGFGMGQSEIQRIFFGNEYIVQTLVTESYNRENILENTEIIAIRKTVAHLKTEGDFSTSGSPIEQKLKKNIFKFSKSKEIYDVERKEYDLRLEENQTIYANLTEEIKNASGSKKAELEKQIKSISQPIIELKQKVDERLVELNYLLDVIISEKAAKDIIAALAISTRAAETLTVKNPNFGYQDMLIRHFMEPKQYDLTTAGRYKLNHKLRLSERLYQKVIANDIFNVDGEIVFKKGTLFNKDELDMFKKLLKEEKLDIYDKYELADETQKISDSRFESITIYADNDQWDDYVPLIGVQPNCSSLALTMQDILAVISYTINLPYNVGSYDDIDHLGNKRLRLIHEQFKNKLNAGMARVEKQIKDKLASLSLATLNEEQKQKNRIKTTLKSVVNTKPFQQVVKAFFNSYQLTQFIDQQNPLSELTNKRRISAMGDGGISREDPNLDIRDVHHSHYGRICPIETPEGMNIGLIMSLASFTKVDENGFLVSPYRRVVNGQILNDIEWLTASREDEYIIAESTVETDEKYKITQEKVVGRYRGIQEIYDVNQINYVDVSPKQVVSIAASCIPFLENDDTTRALMGANMQRQATPLIRPYAPVVGTGSEYKIAHDSGMSIVATEDGEIIKVDGNKIVFQNKKGEEAILNLVKYRKTNQDTCNNQLPIVAVGQKVKTNEVLADGPAMHNGELAIGRNPLIAFTTWHGYNFEDAIIISERLVKDDVYTSIHIDEYEIACLRTKNGDEEISRDLPNVSDDLKRYLDENGIIMVGAEVKEGDILVGKISPKGITDYSPEEKLLNAIFGNKSRGFRDSSLKVPHGGEGTIAAIKRFSTINGDELEDDVIELIKVYVMQKRKIQIGDKMAGRHGNKGIVSKVVPVEDMPYLEDGTPIDIMLNPLGVPSRMNLGQILEVHLGLAMYNLARVDFVKMVLNKEPEEKISQLFGISPNKTKLLVKATKKYFADNKLDSIEKVKPIDMTIILNSCGLTIEDLNLKASTPVFHGADMKDISDTLSQANIDPIKTKGKFRLIDGRTGEYFDDEITIGVMYMLKLDHMVDDKIHARAVGPYSKITQQPLGGRSQNGGQRFGEMEVWALEAYGAAYNLREILTIKSDDVKGRNLTYSAIVKGKDLPDTNIPESFKLLTKQLQGLGMAITVYDDKGNKEDINNFSSVVSNEEIAKYNTDEQVSVETVDYDVDVGDFQ